MSKKRFSKKFLKGFSSFQSGQQVLFEGKSANGVVKILGEYFGKSVKTKSDIPYFVDLIVAYVSKNCKTKSLFRVSGGVDKLRDLVDVVDNDGCVLTIKEMLEVGDIHILCSFLKKYLRTYDGSIFGFENYIGWLILAKECSKNGITKDIEEQIQILLQKLNEGEELLSVQIFELLSKISSKSKSNHMNSENLSIIFASIFIRPKVVDTETLENAEIICKLFEYMIDNSKKIFVNKK